MMSYDVIVIGAGVVGSAVARELSRYQLKTAVLEKELDVACGNSSRNTGMLHAGFTYKPGSLKAECAVEGNQEFDQVAKELGVPFKRTGKLVVGFTDHDRENILKYKAIGEQNGVQGMRMIDKERSTALTRMQAVSLPCMCPPPAFWIRCSTPSVLQRMPVRMASDSTLDRR